MKKILSILLSLTFVVSIFASCNRNNTNNDTTQKVTTIRYLNFKPEIAKVYDDIAKAYEKETGVKLIVETAASGNYEQTLTAKMGTKEAPTLFQINGPKGYANWKNYCADLSNTELYKHLTDKDDYVASKSEMMIANRLYALGIEYEYEKEVWIGGRCFRPDFTIRTKDGRIFYWEHAGMMDDPEYRRRHEEKKAFYERNGIRLQENLIITMDHNGTISMDEIQRTIDFYRLQD